MTMLPVNAGVYPQDVSPNPTKNTPNVVLVKIAVQNAEIFIGWLVSQSIPFELRFSPTSFRELAEGLPVNEFSEEKMPELTVRQRIKATVRKDIETVYQKYIENVNIPSPVVAVVAREVGMCTHTFKVNFQIIYQKSFIQAHLEKRMEHAADLLQQGYPCYQVARMIGYGEKSAIKFNKMFQRYYGMTPKKYQMERKYMLH